MKLKERSALIVDINSNLYLNTCSFSAADYACKHWHYSRSVQRGKHYKIGVWEKGVFKGVVIFSLGSSSSFNKKYDIEKNEICELSRVALKEHENTVTKILKIAIKILKTNNPKLKLIISFSDLDQNHQGVIYQAGNWVYTGQTARAYSYLAPNNRIYHSRSISEAGFNIQFGEYKKVFKPSECKKIKQKGKHRYLYILDNKIKDNVLKYKKEYPKKPSVNDVKVACSTSC
jgi:hypothetical protein